MPRRDYSKVAFAATGDTNIIPTATQPDGTISLQQGWGFDYQRDNGAGGGTPDPLAKNIDREDMNGIFNEITASLGEIQQNGFAIWVSTAAPYPINAVVRHNDINYLSAVTNNNSTPGANTDWVLHSAQATETVLGGAKIATQAQANAGSDDSTIITPKKLRFGFSALFANVGFIIFPTWMGGLVIQWGQVVVGVDVTVPVTYPTAFPNVVYSAYATVNAPAANTGGNYSAYASIPSLIQLNVTQDVSTATGANQAVSWLAIGR